MSKYIGKKLTPILHELSDMLWEIDARGVQEPYNYGDTALADSGKIFMSVMMDRFWALHEEKGTPQEDRVLLVERMGSELHDLIQKHTGALMEDEIKK